MAQASLFSWGEEEPVAPVRAAAPPLWAHQRKQYMAVRAELAKEDVRSTLVVSATGTGKTTLLASVAKTWEGAVLVIAHRDEILTQLQQRLQLVTGEPVEREQADFRASGVARIVVASIQTIGRESRLSRFPPGRFSLVIVDEAHHALANTYQAVLAYFAEAKVLGVTATPDRSDRLAMGKIFDSVASVYDIGDAIGDGVLCPYKRERIVLDMDLSSVGTVAGDFNQGELDEAMGDEHVLEGVAKPTFELAGNRQTVLFTTSVSNAHLLAGILNELRPSCARAVDGSTDKQERRALLAGYARGDFQFLTNCMIATEGWDDPPTSCVAIGRPTKSRALLTQMVGRGLRIHPGKPDCLVLEFTDKTERHDLASPFDILAGKYSDAEVTLAKELGDKRPGERVDVLLAAARAELQQRAARAVKYTTRTVDPFSVFHMDRAADAELDWQFGKKEPSEKQKAVLEKAGLWVPGMSKREASRVLGTLFKRRSLNLASPKQLKTLQRYGVTDINLRFESASRVIDAIAQNGWRAISPDQYRAAITRQVGEDG